MAHLVPNPEFICRAVELKAAQLLDNVRHLPCDAEHVMMLRESIADQVRELIRRGEIHVSTHYQEIHMRDEYYQLLAFIPYAERYVFCGYNYRLYVSRQHVADVVFGPPADPPFTPDGVVNLGYQVKMTMREPMECISFNIDLPGGGLYGP